VAERQGAGREIINDNESKWVQEWNKEKPELRNVTWTSEKDLLAPDVKAANEIICDYVWDELYRPPISVTCSK
jgi:hypothetical protein